MVFHLDIKICFPYSHIDLKRFQSRDSREWQENKKDNDDPGFP